MGRGILLWLLGVPIPVILLLALILLLPTSHSMNANYSDTVIPAAPAVTRQSESPVSAASWPAIFVGAVTAIATSLVLVALGTGFGLASVSHWPHSGASATTFKVETAITMILVKRLSAALGGYIT